MKQNILKFTSAEIGHILNLITTNEEEGCYSGNKEQYWTRNNRIKNKLLEAF